MPGLYPEDRVPGLVIRHTLTRSVTEMDNVLCSSLTFDPQPLHVDVDHVAETEWGPAPVNSPFTLGLSIGLSVHDTTLGTPIGNLGMTDVEFPAPVFHGDTIRAETEVVSARISKSRTDAGIVEVPHRADERDGTRVADAVVKPS